MGQRFTTLDGLRGVAAVAVVGHHARGFFPEAPDFPGSYLAVDLFFALSGFVLAHAYERKIASGLGLGGFMWERFRRLYPLFLLGMLGGLVTLAPAALAGSFNRLESAPFNLLMLPSPITLPTGGGLYPLNPPGWSLFYELVVNVAFVSVVLWPRRWVLALVAAGLLGLVAFSGGGLNGGARWEDAGEALARVVFSFFLGVLVFRSEIWRKVPSLPGFVVAGFIGAIAWQGSRQAVDLAMVVVVFPALLVLGARAQAKGLADAIFRRLGEASYPLYVLHVPMLWAMDTAMSKAGVPYGAWTPLVFVPLALGVSWLAHHAYDGRARALLSIFRATPTARA
jgi:peptidoglycan/LPS O-acetylase OafA/YrhL